MAMKPNYQFEKRQRELAKQKKKEEKAQRKATPSPAPEGAQGEEQRPEGEEKDAGQQ